MFVEMLNTMNPHPEPLIYAGLAAVRYNAAVLFRIPGDIDGNFAKADNFRALGIEDLGDVEVEHRDGKWQFLHGALLALPTGT